MSNEKTPLAKLLERRYKTYEEIRQIRKIETRVTLSKTELLSLLFKLDRDDSNAALLRQADDKKVYYVQAEPDEASGMGQAPMYPPENDRIRAFLRWEAEQKRISAGPQS